MDGWGPVLRELVVLVVLETRVVMRMPAVGRVWGWREQGRWTAGRMYIEGRGWQEVDEKEVGLVEWCWEFLS